MKTNLLVLLALTSLFTSGARAAEPPAPTAFILDLAGVPEISVDALPGTLVTFEVRNIVLSKPYRVTYQQSPIPVTPFPSITTSEFASSCPSAALNAIIAATSESAIAAAIATYESGQRCREGDALVERSKRTVPDDANKALRLRQGHKITLTVEGSSADGSEIEQTWHYVVSGGALGTWATTYGFNFMPNGDKRFQTATDAANAGKFVIKELTDRENLDFSPSIFFNWRRDRLDRDVAAGGPVFGLGFNLDEPIVFGGWGFDVGTNITVALGGALHKETRLAGKYDVGQSLQESLEEAQLEEKTYGLSFFLGFGFRFDKNPFKTGGDSKK